VKYIVLVLIAAVLTTTSGAPQAQAEGEQQKPTPFFQEMRKKKTQKMPDHSTSGTHSGNQASPSPQPLKANSKVKGPTRGILPEAEQQKQ
jgi:hypothetical protein